jgi:hypothetical protein
MSILDSGKREEFETGAVRDTQDGKGRCDLLPLDALTYDATGYVTVFLDHLQNFKNTGDPMHIARAIQKFNNHVFPNWQTAWLELAIHYEDGAAKYGDNNWQKGLPVSRYLSSAIRHYLKYSRGDNDERHDRAVLWNLTAIIWTCLHKPEMNDYKGSSKLKGVRQLVIRH